MFFLFGSDNPVAGVDEAGRGPLAGPVVAAAVVFKKKQIPIGVTDSKKLSPKKREALFERIIECADAWSIGRASVEEIDTLNILQASLLAMKRAIEGIPIRSELTFYVDGNVSPVVDSVNLVSVVRGDFLIPAVGAASILAKVVRDREMMALDLVYPEYGFAIHKGYPTKSHIESLNRFGVCSIHRRSFAPVKKVIQSIG